MHALVIEAHIDLDENWRAQDNRKLVNIAKVVRFFLYLFLAILLSATAHSLS